MSETWPLPIGVCSRRQICAVRDQFVTCTYGKGTLEGNLVLLDALDSGIGDRGLAVLEDRVDVDGLPGDWGLFQRLSALFVVDPVGTGRAEVGEIEDRPWRRRRCP